MTSLDVTHAKTASGYAADRVRAMKHLSRWHPPLAAPWYFPYLHRTVAEVPRG